MSDTVFQIRHQNNKELIFFENFLEKLIRNGNGLVVFSQQKLCSSSSNFFQPEYSMENFKTSLQNKNEFSMSIEDVFEPSVFESGNTLSQFKKNFSVGSFDRLLELLAMGQDFIFSIDKAFKEKIKTTS